MKAEVKEQDVVKHWGIWMVEQNNWWADNSGSIYSVTCPRVANVQYEYIINQYFPKTQYKKTQYNEDNLEVKEIT